MSPARVRQLNEQICLDKMEGGSTPSAPAQDHLLRY